MSRKNMFALFISALVSLGTLFLLFRQVDFDDLSAQLRAADWRYLLGILVLYPLSMLIRAYRWQLLLKEKLAYWRGFHIVNVSYFLNVALPFRLGEIARILLVSREPRQNVGAGLSALTVERLFDLLLALGCVGVGLLLLPTEAKLPQSVTRSLGVLILLVILGMGVVLALPRSHPLVMHLARLFTRPLPATLAEKILHLAEDTLHSFAALATPRRLLTILAWSLLTWATYITFFFIGLFSFFDGLPLGVGFLVTGFVAVGIAAPSLPGAIGVYQAAAVLALDTAGYDAAAATGYAWTLWISQTIAIILGGVVGLSALSLSLGALTRQVQGGLEADAQA